MHKVCGPRKGTKNQLE